MSGGASINWGGLDRALDRAARELSNKKKLLSAVGEVMISGTLQRFQDEEDPDGQPWTATRRGGKILSLTARLQRSIEKHVTDDAVMVGSNLVYALIHQMGGTITPKNGQYLKFKTQGGQWVQVREITIPARPYLGISEDDKEEIKETVSEFLRSAIMGGR